MMLLLYPESVSLPFHLVYLHVHHVHETFVCHLDLLPSASHVQIDFKPNFQR